MNNMILLRVAVMTAVIICMCAIAATQNPFAYVLGGAAVIVLAFIALSLSVDVEKLRDRNVK